MNTHWKHTLIAIIGLMFLMAPRAWSEKYELKIQTAVPSSSMYFETMTRLGKRIESLSGGEIKVEVFPDGAIVKVFPFEGAPGILDVVSEGIINGGQGWTHYWSGKNPAGFLFSAPTAGLGMGLDQDSLLSWAWEDKGGELLNRFYQKELGYNIKAWLCMPMGPEPLGWFPKAFDSLEELKKMKFRSPPGIPGETFKMIGMPVVPLSGGEIVSSAKRDVIDAAEWIGPGDDQLLGLADIWKFYYLEGLHQALSIGDVYINKDWYESLPAHLQLVIHESMKACITDQINMNVTLNSKALKDMVINKDVKLPEAPKEYFEAYVSGIPKILNKYSERYPFFKEVLGSLTEWSEMTVPYRIKVNGLYYKMSKTAMDVGAMSDYGK